MRGGIPIVLQTVRLWTRLKALAATLVVVKGPGCRVMGLIKGAIATLLVFSVMGLTACGGGDGLPESSPRFIKRMSEVSPPILVQTLATLNDSRPAVKIVSPRSEALTDDDVSIRFRVKDLDLYKDDVLELGPHLNILLDNEFYGTVYDTSVPLELPGLTPGTHTIRAIATSAWGESFKNPEAFAQTTFHVFTKTPLTGPPVDKPMLTYSQPASVYGAEPILLDYFVTPGVFDPEKSLNGTTTPPNDNDGGDLIPQGWYVKATINGEPFIFDQWEPIYLKGFKSGKNWVQMELLDSNQNPIESLFNNTARIIQYEPGGDDTLARLMRNEFTLEEVGRLVDPHYEPPTPEVNLPSVDEASVDEVSVDEASVDEVSVDEASVDEASVDEVSVDEASVDEASVDEASVDEASVDEASVDEAAADDILENEEAEVDSVDAPVRDIEVESKVPESAIEELKTDEIDEDVQVDAEVSADEDVQIDRIDIQADETDAGIDEGETLGLDRAVSENSSATISPEETLAPALDALDALDSDSKVVPKEMSEMPKAFQKERQEAIAPSPNPSLGSAPPSIESTPPADWADPIEDDPFAANLNHLSQETAQDDIPSKIFNPGDSSDVASDTDDSSPERPLESSSQDDRESNQAPDRRHGQVPPQRLEIFGEI